MAEVWDELRIQPRAVHALHEGCEGFLTELLHSANRIAAANGREMVTSHDLAAATMHRGLQVRTISDVRRTGYAYEEDIAINESADSADAMQNKVRAIADVQPTDDACEEDTALDENADFEGVLL